MIGSIALERARVHARARPLSLAVTMADGVISFVATAERPQACCQRLLAL